MMASGRLADYLGKGIAEDRPESLDLHPGMLGLYFSTDTEEFSTWNGSGWIENVPGAAAVGASDVTFDGSSSGLNANNVQAAIEEVLSVSQGGGGGGTVYSIFDSGKPGGVPQSQKREYYSLAAGASVNIAEFSGLPGYLSSVFIALGSAPATTLSAMSIRVCYDGETVPAIDLALDRFFMCVYVADSTGMLADFFGYTRPGSSLFSAFNNLPMPYTSGIRIAIYNGSSAAVQLFSTVMAHTDVPNTWARTRKLRAEGTYLASAAPNSVNTLLDVSAIPPGRLAALWFLEDDFPGTLAPHGAALEGNFKFYADGSSVPMYESSGTEDYFLMGYYFGAVAPNQARGEIGTTFASALGTDRQTWGAWRTHIKNPIEFQSALKITWNCGDTSQVAFSGNARVWTTIFYYEGGTE